jgi:hypothetical protein
MKTPIRSTMFISFLAVVLVAAWSGITAPRASQRVNYIEAQQTGLITVNDFTDYRVFQRDIGGSSKSITISGTYSDMTWDHVEARILQNGTDTPVVDWTTIDTTYSGGAFSGALTVPQGGWYNVEVRALDGSGSVLGSSRGTNKWGVGMIILVIGQSNMSGRGKTPYTTAASDLAVNYSNAGIWEHLADPYDDGSPTGAVDYDNDKAAGSMIPAIANTLIPVFNIPIAFVPSSKGGSNLWVNGINYGWAYRNSSNHFDTSTLYGQSITKAQSVGGVELIIMHQGEQDLTDGRTQANYEADFGTMIGHYRQDLYASIPIFICQLGTVGSGTNPGIVGIRSAQHDLDNGSNIFMGATAMDQARFDIWHFDTPGLNVIGSRLANAILYYFGQSAYYRGPSIASASFSDGNRNQVMVMLNHRGGTDITPSTGITGFAVLDNGSTVTITSATRYAANAVQLTLSASISASHTATLRYLYGMTPVVSGLVKDNSPLALPLENTTSDLTIGNPSTPTFTLTASASTEGGTISPAGDIVVYKNSSQTFAITPTAGYHVSDVLVDNISAGAVTSYTFTNVTADHTIAASFAINTYTLAYTAGTGGYLTGNASQVVNYGSDGTSVTAVAETGYQFVNWSDGSTANPRTDTTVTADITVTANFTRITLLGDVNGDSLVNSTDALIVLSGDVGLKVLQFCPMNCGDVNADGLVNSTDALIILSYDVGLSVPFPVGQLGCPSNVTPPQGCTP